MRDYVTDNLSAGIIALDEDDRIIYSNQPAMDFFPSLKTDGKSITSSLIEAYRKKEMVFLDKRVYRPEYRELTKDGRRRGHIIVLSDITDNYQYTMLMKK
ncbi:MAG: PAS domain-containing protein [Firmicutes bacterium]|nr:PAS domain-containing protein [Bacillota bacterium]MDY6160911.1 PAS domain-containing protein [Candidatus Faecousia sp.]